MRAIFSALYGIGSAIALGMMVIVALRSDWDKAMVYGFAAIVLAIWESTSEIAKTRER